MFGKVNFFVDSVLQREIDRKIKNSAKRDNSGDELSPLGACLECVTLLRDLIEISLRSKAGDYCGVHQLETLLGKPDTLAKFSTCVQNSSRIEATVKNVQRITPSDWLFLQLSIVIFPRVKNPVERKQPSCELKLIVQRSSGLAKLYSIKFAKSLQTS